MRMKVIDKKLFKIELILFTISSLLGMCFLFVNKLEPFGDLLLTTYDANIQYLDFFLYYKKLLSSGFKTFYSMGMTLGDSTISVFAYYLASPFNLLFLLFDNENIGTCFNIVVVLKIILSILTCSIFYTFTRIKNRHFNNVFSFYKLRFYAI